MADEGAELRRRDNPAFLAAVGVAVAFVALAVLATVLVLVDGGDPGRPRDVQGEADELAAAWFDAWLADDRRALHELAVAPAAGLDAAVEGFRDGIGAGGDVQVGRASVVGDRATVAFEASFDLPDLGTWTYDGELALADVEVPYEADPDETRPQWRVAFTPAVLHPELTADRRLEVAETWPVRGALQLADGSPIPPALRSVAGSVGPATAEQADALGSRYDEGDVVGQSGLQAGFEEVLAGRPSAEVRLVEGERVVGIEATFPGTPSASVRTTLEPGLLAAAQAALGTGGNPAALVAIRPSTGAVVAIANRPSNGFNRALAGRYPPGSTFKVVTTLALLANGTTPDTRISCPKEITVNGRRIRNAEEEELGDIDFRTAFAHSCNTAFIQLAEKLPAQALIDAARRVGFDADPALGAGAGTSQFPAPNGIVDQVSAAIGQGRVLATPLQMASVAATVAGGGYRRPHLVTPAAPPPAAPLDAGIAATLQELMRRAVADGTGGRAAVPGPPVAGKTGTAEFGTDVPLRTHAWFIGFRGDLAVAVIVEDGGFGGEVAAPLFADFLRRSGG